MTENRRSRAAVSVEGVLKLKMLQEKRTEILRSRITMSYFRANDLLGVA